MDQPPSSDPAADVDIEAAQPSIRSYLRRTRYWLLLPLAAFLLAMFAFGGGILFYALYVVVVAPMGIVSWFQPVALHQITERQSVLMVSLHGVFWVLFLSGTFGCRVLPLKLLRVTWWLLVLMLLMSVSGCAFMAEP